jgi:hypothetical protein
VFFQSAASSWCSFLSNYEVWLLTQHISSQAQVVWPIVGQEILNGDVGGFQGIQITWFFLQLGRKWYYKRTSTYTQLRLVV